MNQYSIRNNIITLSICLMLGLLTSCSKEKIENTPNQVTEKSAEVIKETKESVSDAAAEIKDYTIKSKDKAVAAFKKSLAKIDAEMTAMESWSKEKWDTLSDDSKEKYEKSVAALKEQRNKVSDWAVKLENSTEET